MTSKGKTDDDFAGTGFQLNEARRRVEDVGWRDDRIEELEEAICELYAALDDALREENRGQAEQVRAKYARAKYAWAALGNPDAR